MKKYALSNDNTKFYIRPDNVAQPQYYNQQYYNQQNYSQQNRNQQDYSQQNLNQQSNPDDLTQSQVNRIISRQQQDANGNSNFYFE